MGRTNNCNEKEEIKGTQITPNIYFCPDGKYRWIYEFSMLKNPSILITVFKVMALSFGIVAVFVFCLSLPDTIKHGIQLDLGDARILAILAIVFIAIIVISYLIVAWMYGWKYMVLFEMDEKKIVHIQLAKQFKKAEALGWLTAFAGAISGNLTTTGIGLVTAAKNTSTSEFKNVRKVIAKRRRETIYVNQLLSHNQVYAQKDDFSFVKDYIVAHCPNLKNKEHK